MKRLRSIWATRRSRDALFLLLVLLLAGGTVLALARGGTVLQQSAGAAGTVPPPSTHLVISMSCDGTIALQGQLLDG